VHPESPPDVIALADHVGSTRSIIEFALNSDAKQFIIGTETNIIHQMQLKAPDKEFIPLPGLNSDGDCKCAICPYMALNTMEKLYLALKNEQPEIIIDEELRAAALKPLKRMLEISARAQDARTQQQARKAVNA
jgi:quinolinate synthase